MVATNVEGPNAPAGDWQYTRLIHTHFAGSSGVIGASFSNVLGNSFVVGGCDLVAQVGTSPAGPMFCQFKIGTVAFFYDSQSIGEGDGICFSWRGMHEIRYGDVLGMQIDTAGTSQDLSFSAWGWYYNSPPLLT